MYRGYVGADGVIYTAIWDEPYLSLTARPLNP